VGLLQRTVRTQLAFVFAGAFAAMLSLGAFRPEDRRLPWSALAALLVWGLLFTRSAFRRFRDDSDPTASADGASDRALGYLILPRLRLDLEIGVLLLVLAFAVVEFAGGARSPLYPLVYVLVAFYVSFYPRLLGIGLALATAALDVILVLAHDGADRELLLTHLGFIGFFAVLNLVFTHTEIFRLRHRGEMRLRHALARVRDAARDFRLTEVPALAGAAAGSARASVCPETDAERRVRDPLVGQVSGVQQIQDTLADTLDLLKRCLDLHSCVVLVIDRDRENLKVADIATDAEEINLGPFGLGDGVAGAALRGGKPISLSGLRADYRGLPHYRGPVACRSLLAVPIRDGETWQGVLLADRTAPGPFTAAEQSIVVRAADRVSRTIQNERAFLQLERAKREQERLLQASHRLSGPIREEEVLEASLAAARSIADFEFAAVLAYDSRHGRHQILRAEGDGAGELAGFVFDDNHGLVSMATRAGHYLPYRGDFDGRGQVVFSKRAELEGMASLLILPLTVHETVIGALCLAASRRGAFRDDVRPLLQVLANQVATSLLNARMVRRLAEAATTDPLTGLPNRRSFDAEFDRRYRSAERYRKPLSLIMCDLDFFKKVNDTYGHDIGDEVLRGFAQVLRECMRDLDTCARLGGEEFVVLCEETDAEGARLVAERVRTVLAKREFAAAGTTFHVTCSLGIATFPAHAADPDALAKAADEAVYAAKKGGRNRSVVSVKRR
jgi:diguanylate cyclase (GGDEF)-like protein